MHHLLITIGSHGDTHPFIGLGTRLRQRGHRVTLAANEIFGPLIRGAGLDFAELGSADEYRNALNNPDLWHPFKGFKAVFEGGVLPLMRPVYELIKKHYVPGRTIVAAHAIAFGARIAQEKLGIPLATVHLAPAVFRSATHPPVFVGNGLMQHMPAWVNRILFRLAMDMLVADPVLRPPVNAFRKELGLRPVKYIIDQWWNSPQRIIGLFPDWYAPPPADWPEQLRLTGFPLYDERGAHTLSPEVESFLKSGGAPIAFTFGSAMTHAHEHLAASAAACGLLKRRGLLVTRYPEQVPRNLPPGVIHVEYAPFSELLPRCGALVHHGGIGTTSQALAAGIPQLIVPFAHDQPDNAARIQRLGCGGSLWPREYEPAAIARKLGDLLRRPETRIHCRAIAGRFVGHDALADACGWIERLSPVSSMEFA